MLAGNVPDIPVYKLLSEGDWGEGWSRALVIAVRGCISLSLEIIARLLEEEFSSCQSPTPPFTPAPGVGGGRAEAHMKQMQLEGFKCLWLLCSLAGLAS